MRIIEIINNNVLTEANIVNAGKDTIAIHDSDGNEIESINSFDKIINRFLTTEIFNSRTPDEVKKWFNSNFYKWIKLGAPDAADDMMDEKVFRDTFYVPIKDYIDGLLHHEQPLVKSGKLSADIIMNSFPDYVKKNPGDAVVFSGGRLFRLKKILPSVEKLHEYLIAVVQNNHERNDDIIPPAFALKRLDVLQVPEGFKRTHAWHDYTIQQAEKVSTAKAKQLISSLKAGTDYKVIQEFEDGVKMVKLLTAKSATAEGTIMKHCVASYGNDIQKGKITIYSLRGVEGIPVATIEMKGDSANQVKGPHNSTINKLYHKLLRAFFKEHKISVGADAKHFGGMGSKDE